MPRIRLEASTLLPVLIALSACGTTPYQPAPDEAVQVVQIPLDAAAVSTVEVRVPNGHVMVAHADRLDCEVEVRVRANDPESAARYAKSVMPIPDLDPDDGVRVIGVHAPGVPADLLRVTCVLHAPPQVTVRVLTRQAPVVVRGFAGELQVESDTGAVAARLGDGGRIRVRSRAGGVQVEGLFTAAQVASERGRVKVVMPADDRRPPGRQVEVEVETKESDVTVELEHGCHVAFVARARNSKLVACELASEWETFGLLDDERWRTYRGRIGAGSSVEQPADARVQVTTEAGRIELRCLPGSEGASIPAERP